MKINRFLTFLGASMIMLASCVENELAPELDGDIVFNAAIEAPSSDPQIPFDTHQTKTFIDENGAYESGVGTMWRPKETIGVYSRYSKNAKFTSTNSSNSGKVSFSGLLLSTPEYAYYPYSDANRNVNPTAVKGTMPSNQEYNSVHKDIVGDYRAGVFEERDWFSSTFKFTRLVSILQFVIDATGTPLADSDIRQIEFKVSNQSKIAGNFTINLQTQETSNGSFKEGDDKITMNWINAPTLYSNRSQTAYMTCLPAVEPGDEMTFVITTKTHRATIKRTSKVAFTANGLYYFPLTLKNFPDMTVEQIAIINPSQPETPDVGTHPVLKSMKFTVADNPGKILGRKLVASNYKTSYTTRTEEVCTVDTTNHTISLYLPYLNNRKLVPVFEIPEGTQLFYEGGEIISGETEVDFATYKQIAVVNEVGDGVIYDINFTNTGLPVVVVNQQSGIVTSDSGEYKDGSAAWYSATGTGWQPKDSDWLMSDVSMDNFMVYNADGTSAVTDKNGATVNEPLLASTRVRGNVSQKMPKKPFAVKLDKKSGIFMNDSDQSNDLPAHKRWVLLANWSDRTLMRNAIAFGIADIFKQTFPTDGIGWNPSGQFVELVYNGVHVGNYYLCEQVKIDGNRLDIADPYDKEDAYSGNATDYGYLLECDDAYDEAVKFMSRHYIPFQFKDDADAGGEMLSYASTLVRDVEDKLYNGNYSTAYETLDMTSMVDFLLIQELMMNGEISHPKSSYMYINGGKLYAGPIWDFDWETIPYISEINSKYDDMYTSDDYVYEYNKSMIASAKHYRKSSGYPTKPYESSSWFSSSVDQNYLWYPMLVKDSAFKAEAARRWNMVKGALTAYADVQVPAMAAKIKKSETENWSMWQFESGSSAPKKRHSNYGVGGGFKGDEHLSFDEAVRMLTVNLNNRISGMSYVSNQTWPSIKIQSSTK